MRTASITNNQLPSPIPKQGPIHHLVQSSDTESASLVRQPSNQLNLHLPPAFIQATKAASCQMPQPAPASSAQASQPSPKPAAKPVRSHLIFSARPGRQARLQQVPETGAWGLLAGGSRLETGGWRLETGGWRLVAWDWKAKDQIWKPINDSNLLRH